MTKQFDFVRFYKKSLIISGCLLLVGIIATCIFGVKLDIDFAGGSRFTYSYTGDIDTTAVETVLKDSLGIDVEVTLSSDISGNSKKLVITCADDITNKVDKDALTGILKDAAASEEALSSKENSSEKTTSETTSSETTSSETTSSGTTSSQTSSTASETASGSTSSESAKQEITSETMVDVQTAMVHVLENNFKDNTFELNRNNTVNPSLAGSFFLKALVAVALAAIFVIVYIGIRFRKIGGVSAGISALIALIHDVFIAFFACVIFGLEIDTNFFAVVLTLFGYSLNDTIVIFDRVRENKKYYPARTVREQVNTSINETLARSVMTSLTTFAAITAIVVVAEIFGVTLLRSFAIPMAIGVISGCYSSVFLSGPFWVVWCEHKPEKKKKK